MKESKLLLEKLTERIPPFEGARHNITLVDGTLEIGLLLGDKWLPVRLEDADYGKPVCELIEEIISFAEMR